MGLAWAATFAVLGMVLELMSRRVLGLEVGSDVCRQDSESPFYICDEMLRDSKRNKGKLKKVKEAIAKTYNSKDVIKARAVKKVNRCSKRGDA